MQLKTFLYTILLILSCSIVHGQSKNDVRIFGTVKTNTGSALPGAVIYLRATSLGTSADSSGKFTISKIPAGKYTLIVEYIGYKKDSTHVNLKPGQSMKIDPELAPIDNQLNSVSVYGKSEIQRVRETGFTVSAIDTRRFANTTMNLNQILNRTTGVRIREDGGLGSNFNFSLNGLSGKQVKFFLDGIPMETFGSSISLNNIPANLVQSMEVYKGVVPVSLGSDALGGAVNIVTSQLARQYLDASYSIGSFNTHNASLSARFRDSTGFVINTNAYFNFSDNNYLMRNVEVVENGKFVTKDLPRFHDMYRSFMGQVEAGFANKRWADTFMVGILYSNSFKEYQTAATQEYVLGSLNAKDNFILPTIKYKKSNFLLKGLDVNVFGSYGINQNTVSDTASYIYHWNGRYAASDGELGNGKSIIKYDNIAALGRLNATYRIDDYNSFNLNTTYTLNSRKAQFKSANSYKESLNTLANPNTLIKRVTGIAYENNAFQKRLATVVFLKNYIFQGSMKEARSAEGLNVTIADVKNKYVGYGYGLASRMKLTESIGIKASYEYSYRLQDPEEVFGDGRFVLSNIQLLPERSNNINAGAYFSKRLDQHLFSAEGSYVLRNAFDFIYSIPLGNRMSMYKNAPKVLVTGFEGELSYGFSSLLNVSVNASYINSVNNEKYYKGTIQTDPTYKNRIPNQPYLFGNFEIGIGKNDLFGKKTRIQLSEYTQYIHQYYLTWEGYGSPGYKNTVPTQLIHNLALTYSIQNSKYNISLESKNITNVIAYDNFRLQKPGRAFYLKIRYSLSKNS